MGGTEKHANFMPACRWLKKYFCTAGIASKKMLLIHLQKGSMSQIWDWLCIATDGLHLAWYGGRGIY